MFIFLFRYNEAQMHRLVPWLDRELNYLLNENTAHISYVLDRILELLPQYHITSSEFRDAMCRYFGDRTNHFLHELACFASTPYDMHGYDRNVQYTTESRVSTIVNEVISSTESEASVDSDIVMVSSSVPYTPAGPSRVLEAGSSNNYIPNTNNVIPIETISHSDTDDDNDDVMVVGYIKPPQDRTPEIVDLLGSDSDVVIHEPLQPETQGSNTQEGQANVPLVKVSLKHHRPIYENQYDNSDSDGSYFAPSRKNLRRRWSSNGSRTTLDTHRATPSPSDWSLFSSRSTSKSFSSSFSWSDEDSDSSYNSKRVIKKSKKKKSKKKSSKSKTSTNKSTKQKSPTSSTETNKKKKLKSRSGKGVKSSKKQVQPSESSPVDDAQVQPSTSKKYKVSRSNESTVENRRLKSVVVNVTNNPSVTAESSGCTSAMPSDYVKLNVNDMNSDSAPGTSRIRTTRKRKLSNAKCIKSAPNLTNESDTDDDELPLNLTIKKMRDFS